ncbi:MAG: MaoC family dehydratase [Proteobacteria bacterium]|nr:MaoC family dehydratase [Pseudomonadota bacterium]
MSRWRRQAARGFAPGATFTYSRTFTREDSEAFGDVTRDYNPVHYDRRFTEAKGLPGLICHGLLVAGMICEMGGQVAWLASRMDFRFVRPVYFGDTITCTIVIKDIDPTNRARAEATYVNQDGVVVARGSLEGILPGPAEVEILGEMVAEGDPTNKLRSER